MPHCRTVVLQGDIGSEIKFAIGQVENILDGEWHIAISSLSLRYGPSKVNRSLVSISTNFVTQNSINSDGDIVLEEAPLGITTYGGNSENQVVTLGFRNRDFLYVNKAQQNLCINIKNAEDGSRMTGAKAIVLLCLKRVR